MISQQIDKVKYNMNMNAKNQFRETSLEEAKKIMLDILIELDQICKKNNLTYWLDAGTLLGAIRHKGFIPWDDDIDVAMPRDDYNKFIKIYKQELSPHLFLQTKESDPEFSQYFAKIRNINTLFIEDSEKGKDIKYNQGIFIDIFPVNYIDTKMNHIYPFLRFLGKFFTENRFYIKYSNMDIYKYYIKIFNKLHNKKNNFIRKGPEITSRLKSIEKKDVFPLVKVEFENLTFPAPSNYDKYLKEIYGDYMTLLPLEQREHIRHSHKIYIISDNKMSNK